MQLSASSPAPVTDLVRLTGAGDRIAPSSTPTRALVASSAGARKPLPVSTPITTPAGTPAQETVTHSSLPHRPLLLASTAKSGQQSSLHRPKAQLKTPPSQPGNTPLPRPPPKTPTAALYTPPTAQLVQERRGAPRTLQLAEGGMAELNLVTVAARSPHPFPSVASIRCCN